MEKFSSTVFIILFFLGCEQTNTPASIIESTSNSGNIAFTFDKANAPASVKTLTATLSRNGHTTLSKTINITTDTSATMLFNEVAVGTWKVKVDAKDADGKVLYTGESEVIVVENTLSQVNLTLNPVSSGVGSVQINITWGDNAIRARDFENNPVVKYHYKDSIKYQVTMPTMIYHDNKYRMWYAIHTSPMTIGYASSVDGVQWVQESENPVIVKSNGSDIFPGGVMVHNGKYRMYFNSMSFSGTVVLTATSFDGIAWEMLPDPVLSPVNHEINFGTSSVLMINGMYHLYFYYTDSRDGYRRIGLATSTDGIHFDRYSNNPIVIKTQPWEEKGTYYPSVIADGEGYKMVYATISSDWSKEALGYAVSSDGKTWTKTGSSPLFTLAETSNQWAGLNIGYPAYVKAGNDSRIYYYGYNPQNDVQRQIGFTYLLK